MKRFTTAVLCSLMGIEFSPEQVRAITAPMEPSVIMAGAGSGKTSVMTARVVWLVATAGVPPEGILGLTFTNKAAAEFRSRVRAALARLELPAEAADATTVATYHSFAQQLLLDDGVRIGLETDVQLLSDVRREQLAMRVVRNPASGVGALSHSTKSIVSQLLSLDDRLAEEAVEISAVRNFDEGLIARLSAQDQQASGRELIETSQQRLELVALVEQFRSLKLRAQSIDYADMVRLALRLVSEREDVALRLRTQFPVVLLDEYQDTSVAQRLLMQRIFGGGHAITAVGDALQAIYEWRGASAVNIIDFPRHFGRTGDDGNVVEAPVYGLPKTQRFGSNISQAANDITESLRAEMKHVQALESQSDDRFGMGRLDVALHPDFASELRWIVEQLQAAHAGTAWKDMAVLLRQHKYAADVYEALTAANIPAQIVGKQGLMHIPDVAEIIAYLRVIQDPAANPSWARILTGPRHRLGVRDLAHLGRHARQLAVAPHGEGWEQSLENAAAGSDSVDLVALGEAIADAGSVEGLSAEARDRVQALHDEIRELRRYAGLPIVELIRVVGHRIGLEVEIEASARAVSRGRRGAFESFVELAAGFASLDGSHSLSAFLQWLDDGDRLNRQAQIEHAGDRNAVSIMTVHAAKGLQRDVIVLPALVEGVFPSDRGGAVWTGSADALPFAVLHTEIDADLLRYPSDRPRGIEAKAFAEALRPRKLAEETRLAYVAVTRAQRHLIASAARVYDGKPVEPSRFLLQLRQAAEQREGQVHGWAQAPEAESVSLERRAAWPQEPEPKHAAALRSAAAVVRANQPPPAPSPTGETDSLRIRHWDEAIEHLTAERMQERVREHTVPLPASLSATQVQALARDPEAFLQRVVRPMPKQPALAARRGSAFHAWVEQQFGQQQLFLDVESEGDDDALEALQRAFLASEWAHRTPLALELPFVIGLGPYCVRGRIDAVYRDGDDLIVVDWKTNARHDADALQLDIYRQAAAVHFSVPPARVRACFVYVAQGRTEWHKPRDVLAALERSLAEGLAHPVLDAAPGNRHPGGQ